MESDGIAVNDSLRRVRPRAPPCGATRPPILKPGKARRRGFTRASPGDYPYEELNGGAEGDRTPDLRNAIATLSQLSYGPEPSCRPWVGGSMQAAA